MSIEIRQGKLTALDHHIIIHWHREDGTEGTYFTGIDQNIPLPNGKVWDIRIQFLRDGDVEGLIALAPYVQSLTLDRAELSGENLRKLSVFNRIDSYNHCAGGIDAFKNWRGLEKLELSGFRFTDEEAENLGKVTSLKELSLLGYRMNDYQFAQLAKLKNLEKLKITGCHGFSDKALIKFIKSPIRDLSIASAEGITGIGFHNPSIFPRLEKLTLWGCPINDAGIKEVVKHTNLKSLSLIDCPEITPAGFNELAALKNLHFLELWKCNVIPENLYATFEMRDLNALFLADCFGVKDKCLSILKDHPNAVNMGFRLMKGISDDELSYAAHFPRIIFYNQWNRDWINDKFIKVISTIPNLKELDLQSCELISPWGLRPLQRCTHLEYLNVSNTHVCDEGLINICKITSLKHLRIRGTHIGGRAYPYLRYLINLESIDIYSSDWKKLQELKDWPYLKKLDEKRKNND